jgi:D-alanine-D-alanine ligase
MANTDPAFCNGHVSPALARKLGCVRRGYRYLSIRIKRMEFQPSMADTKRHLVVLFGGQSAEHEVSVISARSMLAELNRDRFHITLVGISRDGVWRHIDESSNVLASGVVDTDAAPRVLVDHNGGGMLVEGDDGSFERLPVDVVFPVLHGPHGEDGTVQGLLELAGIAAVGSGVAGSSVGMDKELSKRVFRAEGLPQLDYAVVRRSKWRAESDTVLDELEERLGFPMFVKPARMGSSVGVSRAHDRESLIVALDEAARFDNKMIVETAAVDCREVECAVLGYEDAQASVLGEIVPDNDFYDYESKYVTGNSELVIPAELSVQITEAIQRLALAAFRAVGAAGLARVDFFVSRDGKHVHVNEINTMPGFTPISMYPKLWAQSGLEYPDLIDRLIDLALDRDQDRKEAEATR